MERGTSTTEKVLAVTFVFCAFMAGFVVMHKEEIMAGNIDQVLAEYAADIKADVAE